MITVHAPLKAAAYIFFCSIFTSAAAYITDNLLCTKNGNSSFFKPKIRGLYTRSVTDQERDIVARVWYINLFLSLSHTLDL